MHCFSHMEYPQVLQMYGGFSSISYHLPCFLQFGQTVLVALVPNFTITECDVDFTH
jgi:hypothetical protein